MMDIHAYWRATLAQRADEMREFFMPDAVISWHNTNESFTVGEYIRANCEYPNEWSGEIERIEQIGDLLITVTHVFTVAGDLSFHAVSFIKMRDDKIAQIDEYWGDDGEAPEWRLALKSQPIGRDSDLLR